MKNGVATLVELETQWNFDDVMRAGAVLDVEAAIQSVQIKPKKK